MGPPGQDRSELLGEVVMQEQEVEVSFCDLCGTSVPAGDIESRQAVSHQGKTIGSCCLSALRASAPGPDAARSVEKVEKPAPADGAPAADGGRLMTVAIVLLAAFAGGVIFLDSRLSRLEDEWGKAQGEVEARQKADSEALLGVAVKLDGMASRTDLRDLADKNGELTKQIAALEAAAAQRQAIVGQELDGLRRALRSAEDKIVDYRPLFEDLRQRHMRDRVAAVPASVPSSPEPAAPEPSAPPSDLPADLAEQVKQLAAADPAVRFEAVDVLIESKNLKVLPHLLPLAKDPDAFVRRLTVEGLREFQKAEAVDALIEALRDEDENVCDTAWRSLRDMTGQKLPFDAAASKESRARAAQKWADWWTKARDTFGS